MKDMLGHELSVGDMVVLVQIPIKHRHELITGSIISFNKCGAVVRICAYERKHDCPDKTWHNVTRTSEQMVKI